MESEEAGLHITLGGEWMSANGNKLGILCNNICGVCSDIPWPKHAHTIDLFLINVVCLKNLHLCELMSSFPVK